MEGEKRDGGGKGERGGGQRETKEGEGRRRRGCILCMIDLLSLNGLKSEC